MEKLKSIFLFIGKSLMWSVITGLAICIIGFPAALASITNHLLWLCIYPLYLGIFITALTTTLD